MDRRMKPEFARQRSSTGTPGTPASPSMSPLHPHHARSGSIGMNPMKKAQTKAAAQRLAQVMSHQTAVDDDDTDEDDLSYEYGGGGIGSIGLAGGRKMQAKSPPKRPTTRTPVPTKTYQFADEEDDSQDYNLTSGSVNIGRPAVRPSPGHAPSPGRAPMTVRTQRDNSSSTRSAAGNCLSLPTNSVEQQSSASLSPLVQPSNSVEQSFARATMTGRSSTNSLEQHPPVHSPKIGRPSISLPEQPTSARSPLATRASTNSLDQPPRSPLVTRASTGSLDQLPSVHSSTAGLGIKAVPLPSSVPISLRPSSPSLKSDRQTDFLKGKRLSLDLGSMKLKDTSAQNSTTALEDELDMLQEENESLIEKLRVAEDRFEESEARAKQLEKQIANFGEGVTLEARHLSRKEAALQQREAALKVVEQACKPEELAALKTEAEVAKDEATTATQQLHEAEVELKWLRNMTRRLILTEEEMEELVMKRCWLARYWSLCVKQGIHQEIAHAKHMYWSSFAPLPVEVVLAAAERAKDDNSFTENDDATQREKILLEAKDLSGEGSIESMLLVEQGLRQLASLKIEEALALAMAKQRRKSALTSGEEELQLPEQFVELVLSKEESEDVRFKQAWLIYFWRRAMNHEVEPEIAEERLQYWIEHSNQSSLSHDAVDVERGLFELRKLGIENQLWQESRRGLEHDGSNSNPHVESEF